MITVAESYARVLRRMPSSLLSAAEQLPARLGLVAEASAGWEGFVELDPNRNLPLFALQRGAPPPDDDTLRRYLHAHHCGGFYGLLIDRIADHQVEAADVLRALHDPLHEAWRASLVEATGSPQAARAALDSALRAWRHGVGAEQRALRGAGRWLVPNYAAVVRRKLRWVGSATVCMVRARFGAEAAVSFRRAHALGMLSMQCVDDALDAADDAARLGRGVPEALGYPPGALLRAGAFLAARASRIAREGGFARYAAWLERRARAVGEMPTEGFPAQVAFGGVVIASQVP